MKKEITIDPRADKELLKLSKDVQYDFISLISLLQSTGKLSEPDAKKVDKDIFEMRAFKNGAYRGFYAYVIENRVILLHFFHKKTQRIPLNKIKLAHQRLKDYV